MKAAIITIGDEILLGQIVNTNAQWIAQQLSSLGIHVYKIITVGDDKQSIQNVLHELDGKTDIAISTGGLGPTKDDITKSTLAEYFRDTLVRHPETEKHVIEMFTRMHFTPTEADLHQALLPSKAEILPNAIGTAPAMWFRRPGFQLISLPGVPQEMKTLMNEQIIPALTERFDLPYIMQRTYVTYGVRESVMSDRLAGFEAGLPEAVSLAYLPNYRRLRLRITVRGKDRKQTSSLLERYAGLLEEALGDISFGYDKFSLEKEIGRIFREKSMSLSVAESFTGGSVMSALTSIPGASKYFKGGIVAYHADVKKDELGVSGKIIDEYSVVSAQTAEAMAEGVRRKFGTDYGIATTGNAGPGKDLTDKSVGEVYLAISSKNGTYSAHRNFGKPREKVIARGTSYLLEMLYKEIRDKK